MDHREIERICDGHDPIWARLPFLVSMAAKVARGRGGGPGETDLLTCLLVELRSLLLDHLEREEHLIVGFADDHDGERVGDGVRALHEEHLAIGELLDRVRLWLAGAGDAGSETERALHAELARLERHVRVQVLVEERILAWR